MDTGLSGVEFETPGRIASTVGENRLKSAFFSKNSLFLPVFSEFFLFGLLKTDRLLAGCRTYRLQCDNNDSLSEPL